MLVKHIKYNNTKEFARCLYLRGIVFGAGQNIAVNDEVDDLEGTCRHILGLDDGQPCTTAHWRVYKQGVAKIERVAVHPDWCRKIWPIEGPRAYASEAPNLPEANGAASEHPHKRGGIGTLLMQAVMDDIRMTAPDCTAYRLGAQDYAIPFYERLGFAVDGADFMDAGIPHHWMQKAA